MAITAAPTFSLKDQLFNRAKVELIAEQIEAVYPQFKQTEFIDKVLGDFLHLELMQRLRWIRDCLREYLPSDYQAAVQIILVSLPAPCDPALTDDDFGEYIYGAYGSFVAVYGCTETDLAFSLQALRTITTRFSVEYAIRDFINAFPVATMAFLADCATDSHYHVRRLASEGTRPTLPWAKQVTIDYKLPLTILEHLYTDCTRYVTRSVANHLNDISKVDPVLVVTTLKRWQKSDKQTAKEIQFIIKHSLRTLEKQGHVSALRLLGYFAVQVDVAEITLQSDTLRLNQALVFTCVITSTSNQSQPLLVDYNLFFQKANGTLAPKTFKLKKVVLEPGQTIELTKRHVLRAMTTRALYLGPHELELQINGKTYPKVGFDLQK